MFTLLGSNGPFDTVMRQLCYRSFGLHDPIDTSPDLDCDKYLNSHTPLGKDSAHSLSLTQTMNFYKNYRCGPM